ncbi:MAG: hypothetical protein AB7S92_13220 [Parvibaculaceae bacterium]
MHDPASDFMQRGAALLIAKGYTRERAEELLNAQRPAAAVENMDEWVEDIMRREAEEEAALHRQSALQEHHGHGIPLRSSQAP